MALTADCRTTSPVVVYCLRCARPTQAWTISRSSGVGLDLAGRQVEFVFHLVGDELPDGVAHRPAAIPGAVPQPFSLAVVEQDRHEMIVVPHGISSEVAEFLLIPR
jgi:hypothetical protein